MAHAAAFSRGVVDPQIMGWVSYSPAISTGVKAVGHTCGERQATDAKARDKHPTRYRPGKGSHAYVGVADWAAHVPLGRVAVAFVLWR